MTQNFGNHRDVDAGREHQRRPAVAQVVEPYPSHAGGPGDLHERLGDVVRTPRVPIDVGEYQVVIGVRVAPLGAACVLVEPVSEQHADGALAEVDPSRLTVPGLGRAEREPLVHGAASGAGPLFALVELDGEQLLPYDEVAGLEVHIAPLQPERLAAAQAGHRHELKDRAERMSGRVVEELAELLA